MEKLTTLYTVRQFADRQPAFPEAGLRWLIFNEDTNGLKGAFLLNCTEN